MIKLAKKKKVVRRRRRTVKRRRRKRDNRIPIVPTIALVSTVVSPCPSGRTILKDITEQRWEDALYDVREKFAGIDNTGKFRPEWLIKTYGPVVVGSLVSRYGGKFVNPTIRKLPFIGSKIKL